MGFTIAEASVDINVAQSKLRSGLAAAKSSIGSALGSITSLVSPMGATIAAAIGSAVAVKEIVGAAVESEQAMGALSLALQQSGKASADSLDKFAALNSQLQSQTNISDEALASAQAYALTLGTLPSDLEGATNSAVGLAGALGMDLESAFKNLKKEADGVPSALTRQIPALAGVGDKASRLAIINEVAAKGMAAQKDKANTLGGQLERLKLATGDIAENIGGMVLPVLKVGATLMARFAETVRDAVPSGNAFSSVFSSAFATLEPILMQTWRVVSAVGNNLYKFGSIVFSVGATIGSALSGPLSTVIGWFGSFLNWLGNLYVAASDFGIRVSTSFSTVGNATETLGGYFANAFETMGGSMTWLGQTWTTVVNAMTATWSVIGTATSATISFLKSAIEGIVFTMINWDLTAKRLQVGLAETFTHIYENTVYVFSNIPVVAQWAWDNVYDLATTALDGILTVMINLGTNIRSLWSGIVSFVSGNGFSVEWTPLLSGFKSAISQMPNISEKVLTDFSEQWAAIDRETQSRMDSFQAKINPELTMKMDEGFIADIKQMAGINAAAAPKGQAIDAVATKNASGKASSIVDAFKSLQMAGLNSADPQKEMVAATKRGAKAQEETAAATKELLKTKGKVELAY